MASGTGEAADDRSGDAHTELCAALRGANRPISAAVVDLARRHRIHLVLAHAMGALVQDENVSARLLAELRTAAMTDLLRERELRRVLGRLGDAGIEALLLKGAGLAYTVYAAAHLRPRTDVDMLIARHDLDAADRALVAGGWHRVVEQSRETVTTQRHYVLEGVPLCAEHLDLHWKIAVPHLFRNALTFDEMASRAVAIDALGPHARTPCLPDALFLACLHRTAHHQDAADLVWLWDIHLLASRLADDQRSFFVDLAGRRAMRAVCARGLEVASACFATPRAAGLLAALHPVAGEPREPSADFLGGGMRQVDLLHRNLSAIDGWRARLTLLGAHLVPSSAYMRSIYPRCPALMLPLAYIHRMVRGAPEWFRRPSSSD
jgi:hypothetical protein